MIRPAVLLVLLLAVGPAPAAPRREPIRIAVEPGPNPWSHLNAFNDPDRFQFAIVTDRTGGHREGVFESAVDKLNLLQPEFVMSVGDLIEGYTEDEADIDRQWDEFTGFIARLQMPFFYVPGNHDYTNPVMAKVWKRRFGRDYYHFVYRNVLFLCLNSEDPKPSHMGEEEFAYAKQALAENPMVRWTLVFFHKPLWTYTKAKDGKPAEPTGWEKIEGLLRGRRYTVFAGHNHHYQKHDRFDSRYFILATTGAISEMRGVPFGEFDHVAWVTMTDAGPIVANLLLSGILDENVVTARSGPLVEKLAQGAPVQLTSLLTGRAAAREFPFTLQCTNDADLPMQVRIAFDPPGSFVVTPALLEGAVPPNSVKTFDARLIAPAPVPPEAVSAIGLDWSMRYPPEGDAGAVALSGHGVVRAEAGYPVARLAKPIDPDGNAGDWGTLPLLCEKTPQPELVQGLWKGPQDLSCRIGVAQDAKDLFVTVDVTDDELVASRDVNPWDQDGLLIVLDARAEAVRLDPKHAAKDAREKGGLSFFLSPGATDEATVRYGKEWYPAGARTGCRTRPGGWTAEIAVPHAVLDKFQGKSWDSLRLNVCIYDFDTSTIRTGLVGYGTYFWWKPDWDSALSFPGSGTFRRH